MKAATITEKIESARREMDQLEAKRGSVHASDSRIPRDDRERVYEEYDRKWYKAKDKMYRYRVMLAEESAKQDAGKKKKAYAYSCPWCLKRGSIARTESEVWKHMSNHLHDPDPKDVPKPLKSNPYNPDNLRRLEDRIDLHTDITHIGPHTDFSAFILKDGYTVASVFGAHTGMADEAMRMSGLDIRRSVDVKEYIAQTGVVCAQKYNSKITISGAPAGATSSQIRTVRDIMVYAKITEPDNIKCTVPSVRARDICADAVEVFA